MRVPTRTRETLRGRDRIRARVCVRVRVRDIRDFKSWIYWRISVARNSDNLVERSTELHAGFDLEFRRGRTNVNAGRFARYELRSPRAPEKMFQRTINLAEAARAESKLY